MAKLIAGLSVAGRTSTPAPSFGLPAEEQGEAMWGVKPLCKDQLWKRCHSGIRTQSNCIPRRARAHRREERQEDGLQYKVNTSSRMMMYNIFLQRVRVFCGDSSRKRNYRSYRRLSCLNVGERAGVITTWAGAGLVVPAVPIVVTRSDEIEVQRRLEFLHKHIGVQGDSHRFTLRGLKLPLAKHR